LTRFLLALLMISAASAAPAQFSICDAPPNSPFASWEARIGLSVIQSIKFSDARNDEFQRGADWVRSQPDEGKSMTREQRMRITRTQRYCDITQAEKEFESEQLAFIRKVKAECGGFSSFRRIGDLNKLSRYEASAVQGVARADELLKSCAEVGIAPNESGVRKFLASLGTAASAGTAQRAQPAARQPISYDPTSRKAAVVSADTARKLIAAAFGEKCEPVLVENGAKRLKTNDERIRRLLAGQWKVRCKNSDLVVDYVVLTPSETRRQSRVLKCVADGQGGASCGNQRNVP
jgi:hypothetical protein